MTKPALVILLVAIMLSVVAITTTQITTAQITPSVPEFTLKFVDSSYDAPTTYAIDHYTGKDITHEGYHVENKSIEVRIKNQPFTPYKIQDSNGNEWTINLYYNIRIKGHFSEDWIELYRPSDGYPQPYSKDDMVLSYVLKPNTDTIWGTKYVTIPAGGQVDFQVEAMIGYISRKFAGNYGIFSFPWVFTGESSGWSNTQTITIPDTSPSPSATDLPATSPSENHTQTPTPEPSLSPQATPNTPQNESFSWPLIVTLGVSVAAIIISAAAMFYVKKRKK